MKKMIEKMALVAVAALALVSCINDSKKESSTEKEEQVAAEPSFDRDNAVFLRVNHVEYYGSLAPQGNNTYEARNICDGNTTTAWSVNLDKMGIYDGDLLRGPVFSLNCKKLSHIIIRNGYGKGSDAFYNNTRAAKIRIVNLVNGNDDRILFAGSLMDTPKPQRLEIPLELPENNNIGQVRVDFNGYYKGKKWNDFCISEIEFWGFE